MRYLKINSNKKSTSILYSIKQLLSILTAKERFKWAIIAGIASFASLLEVATAFLLMFLVQCVGYPEIAQNKLQVVGINLSDSNIIFYMAILVGAFYLFKSLVVMIEVFHQNAVIQNMNYNFKKRFLRKYANNHYGSYLTQNASFGMQIIGIDVERVFTYGMVAISSAFSEIVTLAALVIMMLIVEPMLSLMILSVVLIFSITSTKVLLPIFYRLGARLQMSEMYGNQNLLQFFHAFKEIVLLGKSAYFSCAYDVHSRDKSKTKALQLSLNSIPRISVEIVFVGIFVVTVAYLSLDHNKLISMVGILAGYVYVSFRLMPGLTRIVSYLNTFKSTIPAFESVFSEYTALESEGYLNIPDFVFTKDIELNDVSFKYLNTNKNVTEDVSLVIKKGECIGIIGETGSGKSTLVDLILGLLDPHKGSILVDGKYPVNSYQWHMHIGYVPQNIYLTDDTIESNIAFGEDSVDTVCLNAAIDAAQLRKFIDALPDGTKTIVGERGIRLSGGERQRISIARALYRNPDVLVFDEATSALDNETESKLMDTIHAVSKNRTVIIIAHRLTTLEKCNRIIMMSNGMIEQITSYEEMKDLKAINYA